MKRSMKLTRFLGAAMVAVAAAVPPVAQAASAQAAVPPAIAVPTGNKLFLVGHATGVQIYACNAIGSQGRGARVRVRFPIPLSIPCVRFSRTRLTDDLPGIAYAAPG
jgi:hypothetical protein